MLDVMPIGLLFHTEQGILYANREACRLLKSAKQQLFGRHFMDFVREDEIDETISLFQTAFHGGGKTVERESVICDALAKERLVRIIAGTLPWKGTSIIQVIFQDITDQKRAENSLRALTITDELTGAYNRRHVFYEAGLYLDQTGGSAVKTSVAMVDIDHFKAVNDTHGHAVGDAVLKRLVQLAQQFVPTIHGVDSAIFARIGGEEFLMLLPGLDLKSAKTVGESFRREVERLKLNVDGCDQEISFTISMGIACFEPADGNLDGLLSRADKALYRAKSEGRNRVCVDT